MPIWESLQGDCSKCLFVFISNYELATVFLRMALFGDYIGQKIDTAGSQYWTSEDSKYQTMLCSVKRTTL